MTSEEVKALVVGEIGDQWSRANLHGCDLRRCLVEPVQVVYTEVGAEGRQLPLWVVMVEDPKDIWGYEIVFDEQRRSFGLAFPGKAGKPMFLGYFGSFLETFDAM